MCSSDLHDGFVRGQRRALRVGQAGLGLVDALAAVVQQHEGFAGAARLVIRQKFAIGATVSGWLPTNCWLPTQISANAGSQRRKPH